MLNEQVYGFGSSRGQICIRYTTLWVSKQAGCITEGGLNISWRHTLRKLVHFLSNWMGYDLGDSLPFDFEPNGFPFGSKSKWKLSPRSYPIQCDRKWKYCFLSDRKNVLPGSVVIGPNEDLPLKPLGTVFTCDVRMFQEPLIERPWRKEDLPFGCCGFSFRYF